jgi:hypothetical protein
MDWLRRCKRSRLCGNDKTALIPVPARTCIIGSRRVVLPILFLLLLFLAGTSLPLAAGEITSAGWSGADFIIAFSDSAAYQTDLVASDSSQLVIRLDGALLPQQTTTEYPGPAGRRAVLSRTLDGATRLTLIDTGRLGYSTLWRPYSHRLVVHTFAWAGLEYSREQYHKGLLALEQKLYQQAEELLAVAYSTGEEEAGAVLGVYYAQRGKDSLAARYLQAQTEPDALAARAALARRAGDEATAQNLDAEFRIRLAATSPTRDTAAPVEESRVPRTTSTASNSMGIFGDPRMIAAILFALILVILIVTWAVRRGARIDQQKVERATAASKREAPQTEPAAPSVPDAAVEKSPTPEPVVIPPTVQEAPTPVVDTPAGTPVAEEAPTPVTDTSAGRTTASSAFSGPPLAFQRIESSHEEHPAQFGEEIIYERPAQRAAAASVEAPKAERPDTAPAETATHETLRDPELTSQATEELPQADAGAHHAEDTTPTPPAKPRTPTSIQEPNQRILSTQARELQRKIQSRRPDTPAPAEPTKSAARRLNISRDNVELRRMMEESTKKRAEP